MKVETLNEKRLHETSFVLAEAFFNEPIINQMIPASAPDRTEKIAAYYRWSLLSTGLQNVDIVIDPASNEVIGAALWEPPGYEAKDTSEIAVALAEAQRIAGSEWVRVLDQYTKESASDKLPPKPRWHLVDVGTAAAARGRGVGSFLLNHRLAKIDELLEEVALEATTEASAKLYKRLGFEEIDRLSGVAKGVTLMLRKPKKHSRAIITTQSVGLATIKLLTENGIEALTVSNISKEIGVRSQSLYHHIRDISDAVNAARNVLVGQISLDPLDDPDFKKGVTEFALSYYKTFLPLKKETGVFFVHPITDALTLETYERFLARSVTEGLSDEAALTLLLDIEYTVFSIIFERANVHQIFDTKALQAANLPTLNRLLSSYDTGPEAAELRLKHKISAILIDHTTQRESN